MLSRMFKSTLVRYAFVGGVNTILGYAVYYALLQLGMVYYIAALFCQITAIISGYILNKNFTFASKNSVGKSFIRFTTVQIAQYGLGVLLNTITIYRFGLSPEVSWFVSVLPCIALSYAGNRFWSFKENEIGSGDC